MPDLPKIKRLFSAGFPLAAIIALTLPAHGQKTVVGVVKGGSATVPAGTKPALPVSDAVISSIANAAVVVAAQRLSFNRNDGIALKLLQLGVHFSPNNEKALYIKGLLDAKQPIAPGVLGGRVDEGAFAKYMLALAEKQKPSFFRLLAYNVVALLQPNNRTVIVELHKARQAGISPDIDSALRQLHLPYPVHLLKPPLPPALPEASAKRIAEGAVKLAEREFRLSRQSSKGLQLLQFAKAIHPTNANALLLEALLTSGQPISGIFTEVTEQAFFGYLNQALETGKDDSNLLLLLHSVILQYNPTAFKSVVAMQNAKKANLPTDFRAILNRFNSTRQAAAVAARASGSRGSQRPSGEVVASPSSLDQRLRNSQLAHVLIDRKWTLFNRVTEEQWFFDFRIVGSFSAAQGRCVGKRGTRTHAWQQWMIRDGTLIIDRNAKYVYDQATRQWRQSDGKNTTTIR